MALLSGGRSLAQSSQLNLYSVLIRAETEQALDGTVPADDGDPTLTRHSHSIKHRLLIF